MNCTDQMAASDLMHGPALCAAPDETLSHAEKRLAEAHVSGMPVVDHGKLVGVISQSDLTRYPDMIKGWLDYAEERADWIGSSKWGSKQKAEAPSSGQDVNLLKGVKVKDAMVTQVVTCSPETPVSQVAEQMAGRHIHRVVVVDDGSPVGVISSLDFVKLFCAEAHS